MSSRFDSPHRSRVELADSWAAEFAALVDAQNAPASVTSQLLPGADLSDRSFDNLRPHMLRLVDLLSGAELEATDADPTPFADALRAWGVECCGGWLESLSECFGNGMQSVNELVKSAIAQKLSMLGPQFAFIGQMAGGMVGGVLQRLYAARRQQVAEAAGATASVESLAAERWAQLLPAADRARWCGTLLRDLKRQHEMVQAAAAAGDAVELSDEYRNGRPKRRCVAPASLSASAAASTAGGSGDGDDALQRQLRLAIACVDGASESADAAVRAVPPSLSAAFAERLRSDVAAKRGV